MNKPQAQKTDALQTQARAWANSLHKGQTDKAGNPIIDHVERVVHSVSSKGHYAIITAWLHDVVEDSHKTVEDVRTEFGKAVADAVDAITRRESETYFDYIDRCKKNPIALVVKLADNADNTDPKRIAAIPCPVEREGLKRRYSKAREALMCR